MIITILKTVLILVLCVLASMSDIQNGIVPNILIVVSLVFGVLFDIIGWCFFDSSYIKTQLLNIGIVWLISMLLYAFRIWAGGDCKLMLIVSVIVPYELYAHILNKSISLVAALALTFIISYVYLVVDSVICAIKQKHLINKQKLVTSLKNILYRWISCVSYLVFIDQLLMYTFSSLLKNYQWLLILVNISLVLIITGINVLRNKYVVLAVIAAGIIVKLVIGQPIVNKFMLINYSIAILFIVLRLFIDEYNYETIETSKVEKGMILSLATTLQFTNSKVEGLPCQSTEDLRSRLTVEEAKSVRKWENSKYGTSTVEIVRKIPFAIFISAGTILFMILGAVM